MSTEPGNDLPSASAPADEALRANLTQLVRTLAQGAVLTGERLQETLEDAVKRGRMTRHDAQALAADLLATGRRQTEDLVADLERLLGISRLRDSEPSTVGGAHAGGLLPIEGYEELTAAQVVARLSALDPAQLRAVRRHESRNANRKTVLAAVEKRLA